MTTINNYESLIEKVGGIEKARVIVEGAPERATGIITMLMTMSTTHT